MRSFLVSFLHPFKIQTLGNHTNFMELTEKSHMTFIHLLYIEHTLHTRIHYLAMQTHSKMEKLPENVSMLQFGLLVFYVVVAVAAAATLFVLRNIAFIYARLCLDSRIECIHISLQITCLRFLFFIVPVCRWVASFAYSRFSPSSCMLLCSNALDSTHSHQLLSLFLLLFF